MFPFFIVCFSLFFLFVLCALNFWDVSFSVFVFLEILGCFLVVFFFCVWGGECFRPVVGVLG